MSELTYDDWANLLGAYYLVSANEGRRVYLYIDAATLENLSRLEAGQGNGLESLLEAVRCHRGPKATSVVFSSIVKRFDDWYLGFRELPTPSLPLLAVSVLAATSMGSQDGLAVNDYYSRFRDLTGLPQEGGMPPGFDRSVVYLWQRLRKWMNDDMHQRLGVCTAEEHPQFVNVGWPMSQALWRASDGAQVQRLFDEVFPSSHLPPSDKILIDFVRAWAPRAGLSSNARRFVSDPQWEHQLLATLRDEFTNRPRPVQPEGSSGVVMPHRRPVPQRSPQRSRLKLWLPPGMLSHLRLVGIRPDGWPMDLVMAAPDGREVVLRSVGGADYEQVDHPVTADVLSLGLELQGEDHMLELEAGSAHVLAQDREVGGWSTADRIQLYEPYQVLVEEDAYAEIERDLRRLGATPHRLLGARAPEGWLVVAGFEPTDLQHLPSWLEPLAPRRAERLEVSGGLRASSRPFHYLLGEEPDVALPSDVARGGQAVLLVDKQRTAVAVVGGLARLQSLGMHEGKHEVRYGEFAVVIEISGRAVVDPSQAVRQQLLGGTTSGSAGDDRPSGLGQEPLEPCLIDLDPREVAVQRYAAVVPRAAEATLLGSSPSEIAIPKPQAAPAWLHSVDIYSPDFERDVTFLPAWRIERWAHARNKTVWLAAAEPTYDSVGSAAARRRWAGEVLAAPDPGNDRARALLERYRSVAKRVVADG